MAHAENGIFINRPVAEVFSFILNGDNNPRWRPGVADIQRVTPLPDGVGSKFKQGMKGPTGRIDADYEITRCDPNLHIEFQVTAGPAKPRGAYGFQAGEKATQVTFILDFQPRGLQRLMDGVIEKQMREEVANLKRLKACLETES
jgi:uncharacterized protein YndB with AHSA1/START domain